jgi:hypothetical protein
VANVACPADLRRDSANQNAQIFRARLLDQAADSHMMSRSDFIRVALADRLKADGVDVTRFAGAAYG